MNGFLFIAIYVDEDVNVLVGELLTRRGFQALTARDARQLGKPDPEQLAYVVQQGLTLLTHNGRDFEKLHFQYINASRTHPGIIIAIRLSPYGIADRLLQLLDAVTADKMQNQLLYI